MNQEPGKKKLNLHPDCEAMRHYCDLLHERLLRLILEKDALINNVIPAIEAEYQLCIGYLMYKKFYLQTEINRSKRTMEIIQTDRNHGEPVQPDAVSRMLALEFREWEERLREHLHLIEKAKARDSSTSTLRESRRMCELYRKLVKRLHPDVNPDTYSRNKGLWMQVQLAYRREDTASLEVLWLIARDLVEGGAREMESMEQLRLREGRLKKSIDEIRTIIESIRSSHPYTLKDKLTDRSWVEGQKKVLQQEISELSVSKSRFGIMADQMMEKYRQK